MQKSKKMMVSLCGLALSSLFVLNNKAVVHADTINDANNQNNAISWDSETDTAQNVQSADVQNEQNSDVQSNVQDTQAAQKVDNDQQNATSEQLQRAETSNVESSSVQRRVADQNNDIQRAKISNINATETMPHTVINNPANNKIHVHYTNTEGEAINVGDYDIDTSQNVSDGQFKVPAGYTLSGDGKYSIKVSTDTKYQIAGTVNTIDMNKVDSARDESDIVSKTISLSDADSETVHNIALRYETSVMNAVKSGRIIINDKNAKDGASFIELDPDGDEYDGNEWPTVSDITNFSISANTPDSDSEAEVSQAHLKKGELHYYFSGTTPLGNVFVYTDNVSSTISNDDRDTLLGIWTKYTGGNYTDLENRIWSATYGVRLGCDLLVDGSGRVTKTNHVFNTDSIKSVSGNTVDAILTKPQSVNPATDTRCQASATRVIHVNFPDGQIPVSYKGIVDSNGDLKQTVHFTCTATEDALTGNILQYGNWTSDNQDHNFIGFPERTLPRIPGYTLKITPASVQA